MSRAKKQHPHPIANRVGSVIRASGQSIAIDTVALAKIRRILSRNGYRDLAVTYVPLSRRKTA